MADPYRIFETAETQPIECMQLGPACFPGSLLSFLSSATELSFYLEVICQLHLFPGYVLGDKTKEGKQITTEAHLPVARDCHQESIPAPFPGVPRKISLTLIFCSIWVSCLWVSTSAQPTLIFPSLSILVLSPWILLLTRLQGGWAVLCPLSIMTRLLNSVSVEQVQESHCSYPTAHFIQCAKWSKG